MQPEWNACASILVRCICLPTKGNGPLGWSPNASSAVCMSHLHRRQVAAGWFSFFHFHQSVFSPLTHTSFLCLPQPFLSPGTRMSLLHGSGDESIFFLPSPLPGKRVHLLIDFDESIIFFLMVEQTSDLSKDQMRIVSFTLLTNQGIEAFGKSLVHKQACQLWKKKNTFCTDS